MNIKEFSDILNESIMNNAFKALKEEFLLFKKKFF